MKPALKLIAIFLVSTFAAFFTVFNYVFTDSSGQLGERLLTYVIVFAAYFILGFIAGLLFSNSPVLLPAAAVAAPGLLMLVLYLLKEPGLILLSLFYMLITAFAAYLGAFAANKLLHRNSTGSMH